MDPSWVAGQKNISESFEWPTQLQNGSKASYRPMVMLFILFFGGPGKKKTTVNTIDSNTCQSFYTKSGELHANISSNGKNVSMLHPIMMNTACKYNAWVRSRFLVYITKYTWVIHHPLQTTLLFSAQIVIM